MGLSRLSRRNACIVYSSSLIVTLGIVAAFHSIANIVLCSLLAFCIFAAICVYFIPCCRNSNPTRPTPTNNANRIIKHNPTDDQNTSEVSIQVRPPLLDGTQPSRLHYLDNLKSFLTIIVVTHHISGSFHGIIGDYYNSFLIFAIPFSAIDQSYFMCLFFFISAYFTPTSYDRKGLHKFLSDKFKRLGIPFLCYTFIMGPSLALFISQVVIGSSYSYIPNPGPCWFLAWLLIFNVCYVIMDENVPFYVMKCPSLIRLTIYGAILGVIQLIVFIMVGDSFIFMPITLGSLPFDIVFFTAGVIAKRNKWLTALTQLPSSSVLMIRMMAVLCVFVWIGCWTALYVLDTGFLIPKKGESETDCDPNDDNGSVTINNVYLMVFGFVFGGICCTTFSIVLLNFAASRVNFANTFITFLSTNAYTVYLIHPLVLVPATWTFTQLLKLFNGTEIIFCEDSTASKTHFGGDYLVWVGFFYTICVTMLIVWPLAWCIRRIPGLDKII
eukprot:181184_1